jgi:hypothetical protein
MQTENKSNSKLGVISVAVISAVVIATLVGSYITAYNQAVVFESGISTTDKGTRTALSTYTLTLKDLAQVPEMMVDDLVRYADAVYSGRYGEEGSKALVQFITEQNQNLDTKTYDQIAAVMQSGRKEFQLGQDKKTEQCEQYDRARDFLWQGFWIKRAGFPKKNIEELCKLVLDKSTNEAFRTHEVESIKLK